MLTLIRKLIKGGKLRRV